ncbi:hypothetical protein OPIT5_12870 [Opitutaceae bacterium TAV5]|nr:hypothetical protein OPIT5_12870 [Opitutaceae bacterium TAV5]
MFIAALVLPFTAQADPWFNENFEGWTVNTVLTPTAQAGWTGNNSGTSVVISNGDNHTPGGSQSLYIHDTAAAYTPSATYSLGETVSAGSLDFWFKHTAGTVSYSIGFGNFALGISATALQIRNASGTNVQSVTYTSASFTPGNWNNFNISFDKAANSLVMSLNSTVILSLTGQALIDSGINLEASQITFAAGWLGGTNTAAYYDDISFTAIPEPSTWGAMIGLGALALVAWRRRRSA